MAFTGKATYSAGTTLPELAEDVADIVGIVSPYETPLLDALGDPLYGAKSTHHEWLEDSLLPNKDAINDANFTDPDVDTDFDVDNSDRFRVGDQIQVESSEELMLVTGISGDTLTVVRGYAGTTAEDLADNQVINILGNAALEGADKPATRFTNRVRKGNYTQISLRRWRCRAVIWRPGSWDCRMSWITKSRNGCENCCGTWRIP